MKLSGNISSAPCEVATHVGKQILTLTELSGRLLLADSVVRIVVGKNERYWRTHPMGDVAHLAETGAP